MERLRWCHQFTAGRWKHFLSLLSPSDLTATLHLCSKSEGEKLQVWLICVRHLWTNPRTAQIQGFKWLCHLWAGISVQEVDSDPSNARSTVAPSSVLLVAVQENVCLLMLTLWDFESDHGLLQFRLSGASPWIREFGETSRSWRVEARRFEVWILRRAQPIPRQWIWHGFWISL